MSMQKGFSLVETLIALGLMAGVLTGTGAALAHGARTIVLARETTIATSAARAVIEDLLVPRLEDLPAFVAGSAPGPDAARLTADTRIVPSAAARRWADLVRPALHRGHALVTLEPLAGAGPATIAAAGAIRVRVDVVWSHLGRRRIVSFRTVRF